MADSILDTVKGVIGIATTETTFDIALILEINTALASLTQLGVGPVEGYSITDDTDVWADFLGDATNLEDVKSYVSQKVRLTFDPPQNSFLVDAIQKQIDELTWRIMVKVDPPYVPPVPEEV